MNVTPKVPESVMAGVQVKTPLVLPAPGVKCASEPAGREERLAVSDAMASPSGSETVTVKESRAPRGAFTCDGAWTTGSKSFEKVPEVPVVVAVRESVSLAETSTATVSPTVALTVDATLTTGPFVGASGLRTRRRAICSGALALGGETVMTVLSVTAGSPRVFAARNRIVCGPTSAVCGTQR